MAETEKKAFHQENAADRPAYDDKAQKLEYIRQMLIELRWLSLNLDCEMLSYLIEMSAMESVQCAAAHAQSVQAGEIAAGKLLPA
ncbi:MAG TPA: hypothetical protein VLQ68_10085 [Rhizobiaceae bacterium]|nr:hypothetical protein [Rhizobiaceae bacterium]